MSGRYIHASIIHDKYCDTRERTAHDTHRNFYYGMRASGVSPSKAKLMYWAVRTFGPSWTIEVRFKSTKIGPVKTEIPEILFEPVQSPKVSDKSLELTVPPLFEPCSMWDFLVF